MSALEQHLFDIDLYEFCVVHDVLSAPSIAEIRAANNRLLVTHGEDLVFHGGADHITVSATQVGMKANLVGKRALRSKSR